MFLKLAKFNADPMKSFLRSKEAHTLVWKPNIRILEPFSWTGPVSAFLHEFLHPLQPLACLLEAKMEKVES